MNEISRITREEESNLPLFKSHNEAKEYFLKMYGESFVYDSYSEGTYFYALVFNKNAYDKSILWMNLPYDDERISAYLASYQSIEIGEDGNIHIIH